MAKQLVTASIQAPGFYGLNLQDSSVTLNEGFALVTDNCVIDEFGRLGARKGYEYVSDKVAHADVSLVGGYECISIDGTSTLFGWSNSTFYTSSGDTLTAITNNSSNVFSGNAHWVAATLNDQCFFFSRGFTPMVYNPAGNELIDVATAPEANAVVSAYGRLWVADTSTDKLTVWWSDLLDGTNWTTGSAGSLDLAAILVNGGDEITTFATQAGRLIVLCKNNVVIFSDNDGDNILDPISMRLVEVISGIGCVVRDSVQNVASDVLFLANDGLRSIGRLIQEKGQPLSDVSRNIRDELVREISLSTNKLLIKSVYDQNNAFYLILLPQFTEVYCFDVRQYLQDGSARVTNWENQNQTDMLIVNNELHFTHQHGLVKYGGYTDDGASYTMKYYTNHLDFGDSTTLKKVKRMSLTIVSQSSERERDLLFRVGYDYIASSWYEEYGEMRYTAIAEFNVAEFGVGLYGTGDSTETLRVPMGGSGSVFQAGFEAVIDGYALSVQRVDLYVKQGRIY